MVELIERSNQLVQMQKELSRLKNGADTIQEFSISALRALEFVNQSHSDYEQTKEAIDLLETRLSELKDALEDSHLQSVLSHIATVMASLEAENSVLKPQVESIVSEIDEIKVTLQRVTATEELHQAQVLAKISTLDPEINLLKDQITNVHGLGETNTSRVLAQINNLTPEIDNLKDQVSHVSELQESNTAQVLAKISKLNPEIDQLKDQITNVHDLGETSTARVLTLISDMLPEIDRLKDQLAQMRSLGEGNTTQVLTQIDELRGERKISDEIWAKSFEEVKSQLDQRIISTVNSIKNQHKKSSADSLKAYQGLKRDVDQLNKLVFTITVLMVIMLVITLLPVVLNLF